MIYIISILNKRIHDFPLMKRTSNILQQNENIDESRFIEKNIKDCNIINEYLIQNYAFNDGKIYKYYNSNSVRNQGLI